MKRIYVSAVHRKDPPEEGARDFVFCIDWAESRRVRSFQLAPLPGTGVSRGARGLAVDKERGVLYVACSTNTISAFDLDTGDLRWVYEVFGASELHQIRWQSRREPHQDLDARLVAVSTGTDERVELRPQDDGFTKIWEEPSARFGKHFNSIGWSADGGHEFHVYMHDAAVYDLGHEREILTAVDGLVEPHDVEPWTMGRLLTNSSATGKTYAYGEPGLDWQPEVVFDASWLRRPFESNEPNATYVRGLTRTPRGGFFVGHGRYLTNVARCGEFVTVPFDDSPYTSSYDIVLDPRDWT